MEKDFEQEDYDLYFNRFVRDFLTIELGRIPNIGEVYSEFKVYVYSKNNNIYEIVKKIRQYSGIFSDLIYAKDEDNEIKQIVKDINELRVDVSYPFLMQIYNDYKNRILSNSDLLKIMKLVQSYTQISCIIRHLSKFYRLLMILCNIYILIC